MLEKVLHVRGNSSGEEDLPEALFKEEPYPPDHSGRLDKQNIELMQKM